MEFKIGKNFREYSKVSIQDIEKLVDDLVRELNVEFRKIVVTPRIYGYYDIRVDFRGSNE